MFGLEVVLLEQTDWCDVPAYEIELANTHLSSALPHDLQVNLWQHFALADGQGVLDLGRNAISTEDIHAPDLNSNGIIDAEDLSSIRDSKFLARRLADVIERDQVSIVLAGESHRNEPLEDIPALISELHRRGKDVVWALEVDHYGYEALIETTNGFIKKHKDNPVELARYANYFKDIYLERKKNKFAYDMPADADAFDLDRAWKLTLRDADRFAVAIASGASIEMLDDFHGRREGVTRDRHMRERLEGIHQRVPNNVVIASVGSSHSQIKDQMLNFQNYPNDPKRIEFNVERRMLFKIIKERRLEPDNVLAQQLSTKLGDKKVLSLAFIPSHNSYDVGKPRLRHDAWEVVIPSKATLEY